MEKKPKVLYQGEIECSYCGKMNKLTVERETITPAVPAETEINVTVEQAGIQVRLPVK